MTDNIKEKMDQHQLILQSQKEMICRFLPDTTLTFVNQAFCNMLNKSENELIGQRLLDFLPEENHEFIFKQIEKLSKDNKTNTYEHEVKLPDGSIGYQKWTDYGVFDENDELQKIHSVGRDITKCKDRQRIEKIKTDALFKNSNSAIAMLDSEGKIVDINNEFTDAFGYHLSEVKGEHLDDIMERSKAGYSNRDKTEEILQGRRSRGEGIRYDKEGKLREFLFHGVPIVIEGEVEGAYILYDDITELRRKEKIIESLHDIALELEKLTDIDEVCKNTVEAAENILQLELCNIALVEDEMLKPKVKTSEAKHKKIAITEGIANKAFREGKSIIVDDVQNNSQAKPVESQFKSVISIPIGNYGVFQAVAAEKGAFNQEDLKLAELLVAHTAATLDRIYIQEEIKYKSFHDELTGLYNRRFFEEEKNRLDTKRQLPISLIMVDVNGLKIINDSLGHKKGDELLRKTAEILQNALREEDIIARYGGDEFVILLPKTSSKMAQKISERILQDCEKTAEDELPVSLGVGIATKYDTSENIADVLTKADNNMLQNKLITSRSTKNKIIESLLNVLGSKCDETKEHTRRMTELAHDLGEKVGLSPSELDKLSLLASLHDIGKASISEKILTKPGDLNDEEWEIMKNHPQRGYKIALASEEFAVVAEEILSHHERWDGDGYPRGLKGEEIPYLARILTIVDAYDVMISGRPYQQAVSKEEALAEINKCAGKQFDPELAEEFVGMMREGKNRG